MLKLPCAPNEVIFGELDLSSCTHKLLILIPRIFLDCIPSGSFLIFIVLRAWVTPSDDSSVAKARWVDS